MYYLLALAVIVILLLAGVNFSKNKTSDSAEPNAAIVLNGTHRKFLTLKDIQKQLEVIAKTPPSTTLSPGAMCYVAVPLPVKMEYTCPVCGEKSLYAIEDQNASTEQQKQTLWRTFYTLRDLDECRRLVGQIDKISITLDESRFCKKCSPTVTEQELGIVVNYPDEKLIHRYWGITPDDLQLITEFVGGRTVHKGSNDSKTPVKNYLEHIKTLLVVTEVEKAGGFLSRQSIQEKLQQVAQSPMPQNLKFGAMCYDMALNVTRINYVCPACDEKTIYAAGVDNPVFKPDRTDYTNLWTLEELDTCRRIAGQIKELQIKLDESQFCKKCSPTIKIPKIKLMVFYSGQGKPYCSSEIRKEDMQILKAFLDGQTYYKTDQDGQIAIKSCLPRLEAILGVKTSGVEKP